MLRKINYVLFGLAIGATAIAAPTMVLSGFSVGPYTIAPNETLEVVNPSFGVIKANCIIDTTAEEAVIFIQPKNSKKVFINDVLLEAAGKNVTVHNRDRLQITANSGVKVTLTNYSSSSISTTCSI
ncbi:MAG: hypothetical protein LCH30_12060 [Proteobacteria bacterium]|nr:hypothetical protein [Pseudomonadota bacterium]